MLRNRAPRRKKAGDRVRGKTILYDGGCDALNAVCPYYTMFPLTFPLRVLRSANPGAWVLDPFCGRGSTNFAARLLGLPSLGVDANPVAVAIARAKVIQTTPGRVTRACRDILTVYPKSTNLPAGEFWKRCFHPDTLTDLCKLRDALVDDCSSPTRQALRALLLGRLHGPLTKSGLSSYLSNQMPRTFAAKPGYAVKYWRVNKLRPPKVDVLDVVNRFAERYFGSLPSVGRARIVEGDSRTLDLSQFLPVRAKGRGRIKWIVTSPPYFGMRTYLADQWLRYWFLGGPEDVEYESGAQIGCSNASLFVSNLAKVWSNVADVCAEDARLVIRFGGIPSEAEDPRDLLYQSLVEAGVGWRVITARSAGVARSARRQASQFIESPKRQVAEYDIFVRLNV